MRRALVVDGETCSRRQIIEILEHCCFDQVFEAGDGSQALEIVRGHELLLVVVGTGIPGIDGITVAEKIGIVRPLPVVLLTATADSATVERARLAGVMSYVVTPVHAEQLRVAADLALHQFAELANLREEVGRLRETLETRKLVDRAKGVLMKRGMDEPAAYRRLQKLAMDRRRSLREVAEAILLADG